MDNQQVELLGPKGRIKKDELLRLIIEWLYSHGYNASAVAFEAETHIRYRSPHLDSLRALFLEGSWEQCIEVLLEIKENLGDEETRALALSLILKQWIHEFLSRGDVSSALATLRKDFSALGVRKEKIHFLAEILFDRSFGGELNSGVIDALRLDLVTVLERVLPPPITVPRRRLETLLELGLDFQEQFCWHHNITGATSLYDEKHTCGKNYLPTKTMQILTEHTNEVWFVKFSNKGEYLASSSKDCTALVWEVPERGNLTVKQILRGHEAPVSFVSWSPDDTMLLTCGYKEVLKLWDVETGICIRTFSEHSPILSSCAWFPNFQLVLGSSGLDKDIYRGNFDGTMSRWLRIIEDRISDLAITPDGNIFIFCYMNACSQIWNLRTGKFHCIPQHSRATSVSVSSDSTHLLLNLEGGEIQMWDVHGDMMVPVRFLCHKQAKFVIHSCFGGLDSRFVASGSEDSQVYIWHHFRSGRPMEVLSGHSMAVNCVSWNPKNPQMLASASDDRTIRIWGAAVNEEN